MKDPNRLKNNLTVIRAAVEVHEEAFYRQVDWLLEYPNSTGADKKIAGFYLEKASEESLKAAKRLEDLCR